MRDSVVLLVVALGAFAGTAPAKTKKDAPLSKLFCQARYAYVETEDGDVLDPAVVSDDRDVALALEQHLQDWNRYTLVDRRQDADLVWVVRTGRVAEAGVNASYPTGPRIPPSAGGGPGTLGPGLGGNPKLGANPQDPADPGIGRPQPGASAQAGGPNDLLVIYEGGGQGTPQRSWLWRKAEAQGLIDAGMPLFHQIRNAVDSQCAQPGKP